MIMKHMHHAQEVHNDALRPYPANYPDCGIKTVRDPEPKSLRLYYE